MSTEDTRIDVPIESIRELPPVHEVVITPTVMDKLKAAIRINKEAAGKFMSSEATKTAEFKREFPEISGDYALFYSGTDKESVRGSLMIFNDATVICGGSVYPELSRSLLDRSREVYRNLLLDSKKLNETKAINKAHEEGHYYMSVRYQGELHQEYELVLRDLFARQEHIALNTPVTDEQLAERRALDTRINELIATNFGMLIHDEAMAIHNSLRFCLQQTPDSLDDVTIFEFSTEALILSYTSSFKGDTGFEKIYNSFLDGEEAQLVLFGIGPHVLAHILLFTKDPEIFDKIRNGDMTRVEFLDACAHGLRDAFDNPREFVESICTATGQKEEPSFTIKLDQHSMRTHEKLRALMVD